MREALLIILAIKFIALIAGMIWASRLEHCEKELLGYDCYGTCNECKSKEGV